MVPNSPACSFIQASMAGSRSTAPLNRSNSALSRRSTFCSRDLCSHDLWLCDNLTYTRNEGTSVRVVHDPTDVAGSVFGRSANQQKGFPVCHHLFPRDGVRLVQRDFSNAPRKVGVE